MSETKLTKAQRELLELFAYGPRQDFTDRRVVNALVRKGLVEHFDYVHSESWAITEAGRAVLNAHAA